MSHKYARASLHKMTSRERSIPAKMNGFFDGSGLDQINWPPQKLLQRRG